MIELDDKEKRPPCHPRREERLEEWKEAELCYRGGEPYIAEYLKKHRKERSDSYGERVDRAIHPNYLASVIDTYAGHLFRAAPSRSYSPELQEIVEDADLLGNKLDVFLRDVAAAAQRFDVAPVLVDRWEPAVAPKTEAQEREAGRRPYFRLIKPWDLWDWSIDKRRQFRWAMIREDRPLARSPFAKNEGPAHQWRVWHQDHWQLFVYGDGDTPVLIDQQPHSAGRVPIELLRFGTSCEASILGSPPARDIVRMNRRITNLYSLLDEQIWQYVFSILVVGAGTYDRLEGVNWSVSGAIGLAKDDTVPPFYLSPDVEQIRVIQEQIQETASSIRVLSGLGRQNEGGGSQPSGLAMKMMSVDKVAILKDRATIMEDFEARLMGLALRWSGKDETVDAPTYGKEFLEQEVSTILEEAMSFESLRVGGLANSTNMELVIRSYFADRVPSSEIDAIVDEWKKRAAKNPQEGQLVDDAAGLLSNTFSRAG